MMLRRICSTALLAVLACAAAPALAQPPRPLLAPRVPAATSVAEDGSMLRRELPLQPWRIVKKGETINTGDLIVGLPGAALESKDKAVKLLLLADLDQQSPFPIMEAGVRLNNTTGYDLDVTVDRGRVDLINQKASGPARVRVRIQGGDRGGAEVVLAEPGTRLAVEVYSRWPKGVPFKKAPPKDHHPTTDFVALVVKGRVEVTHGTHQFAMSEPPGAAILYHTLGHEESPVPQRLAELPKWAHPEQQQTERGRMAAAIGQKLRQTLVEKGLEATIDQFIASDVPAERAAALTVMGATDDVQRLGLTIRLTRHSDVWERGVLVLRHWLGRDPKHDLMLYEVLVRVRKMKPAQAETVMQLLHSFSDEALAKPETYEALVAYLEHDELPIRGLAHWHLVRLVPQGRDIKYDPLAAKEEREAALKKWQALIPPGKMPPKPQQR